MTESIGDWLATAARRAGADRGVHVEDEQLSWSGLDQGASRLASGLLALGLAPGERVCVLMRTSTTVLRVWFALARAGLVEVPLNPNSGEVLLRHCLEQSGATAIICDPEFRAQLEPLLSDLPSLRHLIVAGPVGEHVALSALLAEPAGTLPLVDPTSTAVILYTSGTTGAPKGVRLSHRANVNLARHTVELMGYHDADRLYSVFPLYHSNARYCSVMAAAEAGASLLMHRKFSASRFWDICRDQGITAFNYQGAMMSILHKQPPRPDDADNPVRVGFGAPCPPEIFADFEERFGVELTEIYGSTEVSLVCYMPPDRRRIGSAGQESAIYEVAVVDAQDNPVPAGEAGEIVARPRNPGWMFDGYDANAAATTEAWRNLWFHTGDRGTLDADGYLTFLDRMKDTIRRRGENISSWEVERVISDLPQVGQVAAYPVPSDLSEEEVMVAIVPAAGAEVDPAAVIEHCRGRLTGFAVPRYVRLMEQLPLTPSQRVEKYRLRQDGVTPDTYDREGAHV